MTPEFAIICKAVLAALTIACIAWLILYRRERRRQREVFPADGTWRPPQAAPEAPRGEQ